MGPGVEGAERMVTNTLSEPVNVLESVTVTLYQVVAEGTATGLGMVGSLSPVTGVHEYVYGGVPAEASAFSCEGAPRQMESGVAVADTSIILTCSMANLLWTGVPLGPLAMKAAW